MCLNLFPEIPEGLLVGAVWNEWPIFFSLFDSKRLDRIQIPATKAAISIR